MTRARFVIFIAVALFGMAAVACAPRVVDATRLGLDLAKGGEFDAAAVASREAVAYSVAARPATGDLYQPVGRAADGALVLVAGADRVGKDHPLFVAFASALAHAGFTVLVPEIANLRTLRIRRGDEVLVADAVDWLGQRTGRRVGLAGVSYAVGPALLAALDPRVADRVGFVLGIGGFHDLGRVVTGLRNPYGKWLFASANADTVDDPADRTTLMAIAGRKMADLEADVADLFNQLGAEGRAVYAVIDAQDAARADVLVAALPPRLRDEIAGLTLKGRDLSGLKAPLILVHGGDDPLIPPEESVALAAAVGDKADLYLIDHMRHVELSSGWMDLLRLWWVCWRVIGLR